LPIANPIHRNSSRTGRWKQLRSVANRLRYETSVIVRQVRNVVSLVNDFMTSLHIGFPVLARRGWGRIDPALGIVLGLVLLIIVVAIAIRQPRRCDLCGNLIKRVWYTWRLNGRDRAVCPYCSRRMEQQKSREATREWQAPQEQQLVSEVSPIDVEPVNLHLATRSEPTQVLSCPHCNGHIGFDANFAGRVVTCPYCTGQFQMPAHA
jgi:hypothetical protein